MKIPDKMSLDISLSQSYMTARLEITSMHMAVGFIVASLLGLGCASAFANEEVAKVCEMTKDSTCVRLEGHLPRSADDANLFDLWGGMPAKQIWDQLTGPGVKYFGETTGRAWRMGKQITCEKFPDPFQKLGDDTRYYYRCMFYLGKNGEFAAPEL
jgi:hypothetical protein